MIFKQKTVEEELSFEHMEKSDISTAMILGVAGGNGLEYVDKNKFNRVYAVDINEEYLKTVSARYSSSKIKHYTENLPNGKALVRMDFTKN